MSLTITTLPNLWNISRLYGRCNTVYRSTRWYTIDKDFIPADSQQNITRPKNSLKESGVATSHTNMSFPVTTQRTISIETEKFYVVIYGVIGGAAACLALLLALVIFLVRKVKEQRKTIEMTNDEIDEFRLGIAAEKARAKGINGLFILPYDTSLEIPKSDVTFRENFNFVVFSG